MKILDDATGFQAAGPYLDQILELVEDEEAPFVSNGYLMGI